MLTSKIPFQAYLELTKPRILVMVLVTTTMGFFLGGVGVQSSWHLLLTLIGTGLAAGGANVLNHYLERDADSKMERTRNRPIPAGIILPSEALAFGMISILAGVILLVSSVNLLTGFLVLLTAFLYVLVYTPMKKWTWLNTSIGAIPGALPPMAGWTAATGQIDIGAWVLFWILFLWQHPHFFAIAWMFKEDYAKGGFKMLPVVEPDGKRTFRQILWHSFLLLLVSLLPTVIGMSGRVYFYGALFMGLGLLSVAVMFSISRSVPDARKLLRASVIYLPLLLILIILDSGF